MWVGWSRYPGLDFWISHWLAVGGPLSVNFWDVEKFYKFSRDGYWIFWLINWHECVNMCEFTEHFFIIFFWVRSPRYSRSSNFAKTKNHPFTAWRVDDRGAMSMVICRGPFYLAKDTFWEFLPFTVFVVNLRNCDFFKRFCVNGL